MSVDNLQQRKVNICGITAVPSFVAYNEEWQETSGYWLCDTCLSTFGSGAHRPTHRDDCTQEKELQHKFIYEHLIYVLGPKENGWYFPFKGEIETIKNLAKNNIEKSSVKPSRRSQSLPDSPFLKHPSFTCDTSKEILQQKVNIHAYSTVPGFVAYNERWRETSGYWLCDTCLSTFRSGVSEPLHNDHCQLEEELQKRFIYEHLVYVLGPKENGSHFPFKGEIEIIKKIAKDNIKKKDSEKTSRRSSIVPDSTFLQESGSACEPSYSSQRSEESSEKSPRGSFSASFDSLKAHLHLKSPTFSSEKSARRSLSMPDFSLPNEDEKQPSVTCPNHRVSNVFGMAKNDKGSKKTSRKSTSLPELEAIKLPLPYLPLSSSESPSETEKQHKPNSGWHLPHLKFPKSLYEDEKLSPENFQRLSQPSNASHIGRHLAGLKSHADLSKDEEPHKGTHPCNRDVKVHFKKDDKKT